MIDQLPMLLFISLLVGAAIGLQRESNGQGDSLGSAGGVRTYSLVSLLGGLAGFFYTEQVSALFLFLLILIGVFVVAYYILGSLMTERLGLTNEMSIIYAFLISFLITSQLMPIRIALALLVVVLLVLSLKTKMRQWMHGISNKEIEAFISYAIITVVVLPFLPNTPFQLQDIPYIQTLLQSYHVDLGQWATLEIFNLRKVGLVVALVTGIDVFGYLLGKAIGNKKSFTLASFVGGFISSTSTTQSLAQKSKKTGVINSLVGAALLANMASFFQIFLLVGPLNSAWLVAITPTLVIIIVAAFVMAGIYLSRRTTETQEDTTQQEKKGAIFSLAPALKFAGLLIVVKLVTKICLVLFGQSGFIISSVIASFAGIDAIVINLADMAGGAITFKMALIVFILVNATNLASKSIYSFLQGDRRFAWKFVTSVGVIVASSLLGLLFLR